MMFKVLLIYFDKHTFLTQSIYMHYLSYAICDLLCYL